MKTRIVTALGIILVCALPVLFGGVPLEVLAILVLAGGCFEWLKTQAEFNRWPLWIMGLCFLLTLASRYIPNQFLFPYVIVCVVLFWSLNLFLEEVTIDNSYSMITFFVLFSLIYRCIGLLQENHYYLITIVFATYGSDTGAWFFGRRYGKHKLNPRISPKKSWEGFIGGCIAGFVIGWIPYFFYAQEVNIILILLLCLLCPVVAEFGDLCFSAIKRYYRIKDFSNLLPGHGGILDRVDSLLMNILLYGVLVTVFFV